MFATAKLNRALLSHVFKSSLGAILGISLHKEGVFPPSLLLDMVFERRLFAEFGTELSYKNRVREIQRPKF